MSVVKILVGFALMAIAAWMWDEAARKIKDPWVAIPSIAFIFAVGSAGLWLIAD
jgi:hypothetical protein